MSGKETATDDYSFRENISGAAEAYKRVRKIGIAVGVGFAIAVIISFPAALLIAEIVQTHIHMFGIGAGLATIGMGSVLSQFFLNIEKGHHSIRPTPEWIASTRLKLILLSISFAGFLTAGFLPVEQPEVVWENPVAKVFNTTSLVLAGTLAPYMIKMITDFAHVDPELVDKRIKQLMLMFPVFFFSLIIVVHRIAIPNKPTQSVVIYGITSVAGALSLLYTYSQEKPNHGWRADANSEVNDYWIVTELRKVGYRTYFLATLGWVGYILAAGTRSGTEVSFSSEVHLFPTLIAFRGVVGVLAAVLVIVVTAVLARVLVSSVRLYTST